MADPFDSSALFAEFNRPREASDRILMSNLKENNQKKGSGQLDFDSPAEKGSKTNKSASSPGGSASSSDASSSEEESETETAGKEDEDGPVEIGRDEAGCIMYRPGERERRVGMKLLQNADYGDGNYQQSDHPQAGDNGDDNRDELQKLRVTNTMYRRQTRLIDPTRHIPADEHTEGPALQVLFMNHDFARKYRADIERFISDMIYRDMMDQPMRPVRERPHHVCLAEGAAEVKDQDTNFHEHRTSTVIGASRFYTDFVVDSMGFPLVDYIPALSDGWEIPRYEQQFKKVLPAESDSEDDDKPPPPQKGSMCFNCGGDHRLNECQEQRDFQRISANRNKFQAKSKSMQGTLNKGIEDSSGKFAQFKAGVYSAGLLEALGCQPNRLPFFVYRMRQLGYPPGYLMQAEVERSGIAMFDKDGQALKSEKQSEHHESGSLEDGEMNEDGDDDRVVYNVDKLIDFPGFNVPVPEDIPDEGHRYGCPPMQPKQSKEYMQHNLPTPRGVKRQNTRKEEHGGKRRRLVEDMDLDESATEPGMSRSSSCGSFSRSDTPTLEDLEAQQRLLQQALGDDDSQGSAGTPGGVDPISQQSSRASSVDNTEGHTFTVPEVPGTPGTPVPGPPNTPGGGNIPLPAPMPHGLPPQTPPAPPLPPGTPPVTPRTPHSGGPLSSSTPGSDSFTTPVNSHSANSSLNRSNSASIERTLSTPVRRKCVEDLPDPTQFRVGVQDHIPFENLPDAVGTYNKMKDVISEIRKLKKKKSQ